MRKKETIEEAAKEYSELIPFVNEIVTDNSRLDFEAGAKWQQERSYSEEEVLELFKQFDMHLPFNYEFLLKEQFKKQ